MLELLSVIDGKVIGVIALAVALLTLHMIATSPTGGSHDD